MTLKVLMIKMFYHCYYHDYYSTNTTVLTAVLLKGNVWPCSNFLFLPTDGAVMLLTKKSLWLLKCLVSHEVLHVTLYVLCVWVFFSCCCFFDYVTKSVVKCKSVCIFFLNIKS